MRVERGRGEGLDEVERRVKGRGEEKVKGKSGEKEKGL